MKADQITRRAVNKPLLNQLSNIRPNLLKYCETMNACCEIWDANDE